MVTAVYKQGRNNPRNESLFEKSKRYLKQNTFVLIEATTPASTSPTTIRAHIASPTTSNHLSRIDVPEQPSTTRQLPSDCEKRGSVFFSLDLSREIITTEKLTALVANNLHLKSLKLSWCEVTDTGLECLAPLTKLQHLDLSFCPLVKNETFTKLQPLQSLTDLTLKNCTGLRQGCLTAILNNTPNLKTLDLSYSPITDHDLENLTNELSQGKHPKLQRLILRGSKWITPTGLAKLKAQHPNLRIK